MIEDGIESDLEFLLRSLSAENLNTAENRLRSWLVERGIVHHRHAIIFLRIIEVGYSTKVPPSENRGQTGHCTLIVGRNGEAFRIQSERAIQIQTVKADGKELHDFACIILVRMRPGVGITFVVPQHVEV